MQDRRFLLEVRGSLFFSPKDQKEPKDFLEGFWNTIIPAMPSAEIL